MILVLRHEPCNDAMEYNNNLSSPGGSVLVRTPFHVTNLTHADQQTQ